MKVFLVTKKEGLENFLEGVGPHHFEVVRVSTESELFGHDLTKSILVIDLDSLKDHGFTLATKLANHPERKSLIIGITSLDVDSANSSFDFFFESMQVAKENFKTILDEYEKL